jgi:16S rRNA processing protein RimM
VAIALRTDDPDTRFGVGALLYPVGRPGQRQSPGALEVTSSRWHSGRLLVRFAQCPDRTSVEALAGAVLEAEVDVAAPGPDPEEFHDLALVGLSVEDREGARLGQVIGVVHLPGQDLLEIDRDPEPFLIPFVAALVPVVDVPGGRIVVDLPAGLVPPDSDTGTADSPQPGEDVSR